MPPHMHTASVCASLRQWVVFSDIPWVLRQLRYVSSMSLSHFFRTRRCPFYQQVPAELKFEPSTADSWVANVFDYEL